MHIMFIPSWYSNVRNKVHGSFFKEQASELQKAGVKVTVAYNEVWPLTMIGKIHEEKGLNYNIEASSLSCFLRFRLPSNPWWMSIL